MTPKDRAVQRLFEARGQVILAWDAFETMLRHFADHPTVKGACILSDYEYELSGDSYISEDLAEALGVSPTDEEYERHLREEREAKQSRQLRLVKPTE